jgi:hypothetical protein
MLTLVATLGVVASAACGDDGPTSSERAVCDSLQRLVHDLESGQPTAALEELAALDDLVRESGNQTMVDAGARFFSAISEPVDYGALTVDESVELGNRVLEESALGVDALGTECDRIGLTVEADRAKLDAQTPE